MKILVVGGGGREHAIIKQLKQNPAVESSVCRPRKAGIAADAECVPIKATDIDGIVNYVKIIPWTSPWSRRTIRWPWAVWTGCTNWA